MENELNALIIGDELGLSETIRQYLIKKGYAVETFLKGDDAYPSLSSKKFDLIIVDCMLPGGMNGVDLLLHVKENFGQHKAQFILSSAVFTDKNFVAESLARTKAAAFIEKKSSFDPEILATFLKKKKATQDKLVPEAHRALYEMFGKEKISAREKRKVIESLEEVSGFDLPFIYSLLAESKSSGYLNIYKSDGSVAGVSFCHGKIIDVDSEDQSTFLGKMLIQSGYARPQDVNEALSEKTNMRIGTKLVNANLLSPHAFDLILMDQMNLRLSQGIKDEKIKIHFATSEIEESTPNIDSEQLLPYLHDWIASKISDEWLKSLYVQWSSNILKISTVYSADHPALQMGLIQGLPGLVEQLQEGTTLNSIMAKKIYADNLLFKGIHFLLTKGIILFGERIAYRSLAEQQAALSKVWQDINSKDPVEVVQFLGQDSLLGEKLELLLGPKPDDVQSPTYALWKNVKNKIDEAAKSNTSQKTKEEFLQSLATKKAEEKILLNKKIEEAKNALLLNQFSKALSLLQEVQKKNNTAERLYIYLSWAKVGMLEESKKTIQLKEIEMDIVQIPAEERYEAIYPLVLGMFYRSKGDYANAKKSIEKSLALDSGLIPARRELSKINESMKKDKDIFNMDLRTLVGGIFGKK